MRVRTVVVCAATCVMTAAGMPAQEREDRTLLSNEQMRAIVNEASGERAMHHVLELVPYQRVRPASEYQGPFRPASRRRRVSPRRRSAGRSNRESAATWH